ncbi:MAG: sulfite exporter TauE/SafE family protein [Alphaproteobacteria bacterium]|nr:sulfite exporter TauE/SafE family protein [Alphaproteobacteria bacterium]
MMDVTSVLMLFFAGVIGGSLSGIVGGASLVTFPTLLWVGLSPIAAAASNVCSMLFANIAAALADRSKLPAPDRSFAGLVAASIVGAIAGAALLMVTPARLFEVLVPVLIGFATALFWLSPRVSAWLRARAEAAGRAAPRVGAGTVPLMLPVSVYGGYFGAGVGVLALAVTSIGTGGEYRSANVTKNVVIALNTVAAAAMLGVYGAVNWPPTLVMMVGGAFGGMLGGTIGRFVPQDIMRIGIIVFGVLLTAIYAWRYWL